VKWNLRPAYGRWTLPVLAIALLPASYYGATAALDHVNASGPAGSLAADCGATCGNTATTPAAASSPAPSAVGQAAHSPARHTPGRHAPAAQQPATASPSGRAAPHTLPHPAPQASRPAPPRTDTPPPRRPRPPRPPQPRRPHVTASYQPGQRWPGGFTGQFTIVNDGRKPISGWQLTATLPGDQVRDVQGADWSTSGDTLVMQPPRYGGPLQPGASLTISIVAYGNDDTPATCSLDSHSCE
jgi:cellulase/cellobiase CelA1